MPLFDAKKSNGDTDMGYVKYEYTGKTTWSDPSSFHKFKPQMNFSVAAANWVSKKIPKETKDFFREILGDFEQITQNEGSFDRAMIAGGYLRDTVRGVKPKDLDIWVGRHAGRAATVKLVDSLISIGWPRPKEIYATAHQHFPSFSFSIRPKGVEARSDSPLNASIREIVKFELANGMSVDLIMVKPGFFPASRLPLYFDIRACAISVNYAPTLGHKLRFAAAAGVSQDINNRRLKVLDKHGDESNLERAHKLAERFSEQDGVKWTVEVTT